MTRDTHFPHQNKQISFNSGSKKVIHNAFYMHFIKIGNAYYNKKIFFFSFLHYFNWVVELQHE